MKKQTRATHFITILLLALVLAAGSGIRTDAADKPVSMFKGESYSLKKAGAAGYKSSDSSVVKVSSKGTIKGVKKGNAKITYKIGKKKYTKEVYVIDTKLTCRSFDSGNSPVNGKTAYVCRDEKAYGIYSNNPSTILCQYASGKAGVKVTVSCSDSSIISLRTKMQDRMWYLDAGEKYGTAEIKVSYKATTGTRTESFKVQNVSFKEALDTYIATGKQKYKNVCELNLDYADSAREVRKIIPVIIKPGMTDVEKVNAVVVWMCENIDYYYSDKHTSDPNFSQYEKFHHDAKGAFLYHLVVCEGYAKAFNIFMDELGIDNMIVVNSVHAWNLVKMEDGWYQVDVTFADPWEDSSKVDYDYVLFTSDSYHKYNKESHQSSRIAPECNGTKYTKYFVNYFRAIGKLINQEPNYYTTAEGSVRIEDIKSEFGFDW